MAKRKPKSTKGKKRNPKTSRLEERWRAFAEAYLDIGKPTFQRVMPSAIAAGYSESYAKGLAYKLLDHIGVRKWLDIVRIARAKADVAPAEETLAWLSRVMRGNPCDLENPREEGGGLRELSDMDRGVAQALIAGVKRKTRIIPGGENGDITEHTLEYKLLDRLKAAHMLAQYHGLIGGREDQRTMTVKETKILVGYPVEPMPLAEWERQVKEMLGYNQPLDMPEISISE